MWVGRRRGSINAVAVLCLIFGVFFELKFADHETELDMAVNDPDERPTAPADGTQRVPSNGLGAMFRFDFATPEQPEREVQA